jgi:Protein of unknown function (DUF4235)
VKVLFIPFNVIGGRISGFVGKKLFEGLWGVIDDQEPPGPEHRDASVRKIVLASALEAAVFRGTRAAVDHQMRRAFAALTGTWPGEDAPEPD